jgi:hypothetical protein
LFLLLFPHRRQQLSDLGVVQPGAELNQHRQPGGRQRMPEGAHFHAPLAQFLRGERRIVGEPRRRAPQPRRIGGQLFAAMPVVQLGKAPIDQLPLGRVELQVAAHPAVGQAVGAIIDKRGGAAAHPAERQQGEQDQQGAAGADRQGLGLLGGDRPGKRYNGFR